MPGTSASGSPVHAATATVAVIYAAKSTEDRHGSVPTQLEQCRAESARRGWTVLEEYQDVGFSAFKGNRGPGLENAIAHAVSAATEHGTCVLLAQHSDRFARGSGIGPGAPVHLGELYFKLGRLDVAPLSIQDPETFANPVNAVLMGARNHEDSKRKRVAVQNGKRRSFDRGAWGGGPAPDGYIMRRTVDERGQVVSALVHDQRRATVVRTIFELAADNHGDATIARRLNAGGWRTAAGRAWSRRRVQDTLTNPVYAGAVVWHRGGADQEINWRAEHPSLVAAEEFLRLTELRAQRDRAASGRPRGGRRTGRYLLARLAACDLCGATMYASTSPYVRKDGTSARKYMCANVHGGTGLCDAAPLDAELVDGMLLTQLENMMLDFPRYVESLLSGHIADREELERRRDSHLARLDAIDGDAHRLEREYIDRVTSDQRIAADAAARGLERLTAERQRVSDELAEAQTALDAAASHLPDDLLLDSYEAHRRLLDRLRQADAVEHANEELRAHFSAFRLSSEQLDTKVLAVGIEPILRPDSPMVATHPGYLVETGTLSQEQFLVSTRRLRFPRLGIELPSRGLHGRRALAAEAPLA